MNYYTLKSVKGTIASIEFVIGGVKVTKNFDARYLPLDSKEALDAYCKNWMDNYTPSETAIAISEEVEALLGKKQEVDNG